VRNRSRGANRREVFFAIVLGALLLTAGVSFAGTLVSPGVSPFPVPGDGAGNPVSFTIQATGFGDGDSVFVEQCDGRDPGLPTWSATADCDAQSAAGPAIAAIDTGDVTFVADDSVTGFHPFKGASPMGQFNCLSPNQASPNN